jgi:3'(2'), 5'-bisphosphate nucleotidase
MKSNADIDKIAEVALEAGQLLLKYWPTANTDSELVQVEKIDGTVVTKADMAAHTFIVDRLKILFPGLTVISEEDQDLKSIAPNESHFMIIDPLDGTSSFIAGRDDFSVLIAEVIHAIPTASVMYFPALKILVKSFFAPKEPKGSAFINEVPCNVSKSVVIRSGRVSCRKCRELKDERILTTPLDSGFALMEVARGNLDGVVIRMLTHREWDIIAPTVAIKAAGGEVSDENGKALIYNKLGIDYKYFVASNGLCHKELLNLVRDIDEK